MTFEENIHGQVDKIVLADYDITNPTKFPELTKNMHMEKSTSGELVLEEWVVALSKSWVLNPLEVPFFGETS